MKKKAKLQDESNTTDEDDFTATFEISLNQIQIPIYNLFKYSQSIQKEIRRNKIFSELNNSIQKVSIKNQRSINTFLQLLNDKETEIKNDEFTDLLKISEIFEVRELKSILQKYIREHSNDVDFILSLKIEQENSDEKNEFLNKIILEEMDECLKSNINECLKNKKIEEISVSSIYNMIEKSYKEKISNDVLCHFILKSIKERHALLHFVDIEKLSDKVFEEIIKFYENCKTSNPNQIYYFDFLPINLSYINKLKEKQKSLEKQRKEEINIKDQEISEMKKLNQQLEIQYKKEINLKEQKIDEIKKSNQQLEIQYKKEINLKEQKIDEIKKSNQQLERQHKEEIKLKEQEINGMKKLNQQLEIQHKEEINQKEQKIDEIKKLNQQLEIQYKKVINLKDQEIDEIKKLNQQLKMPKNDQETKNNKEQNKISFEIIKELLTKYDIKSYNKSGIYFIFSSKYLTNCMPNRK